MTCDSVINSVRVSVFVLLVVMSPAGVPMLALLLLVLVAAPLAARADYVVTDRSPEYGAFFNITIGPWPTSNAFAVKFDYAPTAAAAGALTLSLSKVGFWSGSCTNLASGGIVGVYAASSLSGTLLASRSFGTADLNSTANAPTELALTAAPGAPALTSGQAVFVVVHAPGLCLSGFQLTGQQALYDAPGLNTSVLPSALTIRAVTGNSSVASIAAYLVVDATLAGTSPPPTTAAPTTTPPPTTTEPPQTLNTTTPPPSKKSKKKVGALPAWAFVLIMIVIVMIILSVVVSFVVKKCQDED